MNILQGAIERALQQLPEQMLSQLVAEKLAAQGIKLSKRQHQLLVKHIREGRDTFRMGRWSWWDRRRIQLDFTPQDIQKLEHQFTKFLDTKLSDLIQAAMRETAAIILTDLKRKWRTESRRQQREVAGFAKRLYDRWGVALESLKMLVTISRELGANVNEELRNSSEPGREHLIEVLTRSHARSCQITEEIICLLLAGFADGAMARWRTLHEVAVVALFIADRGEQLAERYILHQVVESKRAASDYEKYRERLGYEQLGEAEMKALETSHDALIARFGASFKNQYGWAADDLAMRNPTFADLELAAGINHFRPHYRMASHNVHANSKGVFFKLGLLNECQVLLSGPSNAGLADPGHSAAISLAQVSTTLNTLSPTFDNIVALQIIMQLVDEVGDAFIEAHLKLEEDSAIVSAD